MDLYDLAGNIKAIDIEAEAQRIDCIDQSESWVEDHIADPVALLAQIIRECATERDATVLGQRVAAIVQQEWRRVARHNVMRSE